MNFVFPLVCALLALAGGTVLARDRPNIVIIMVDDMGISDIGCYGSEIPTPHLDALAENGLRFSQFYNTGRCCPSRASLLTGLYSHQAGVGGMTADQGVDGYRGRLNGRCVTIAEVLNTAGYFTGMTGKWHLGSNHGVTPPSRGFQRSLNLPSGGLHYSNQTGPKGGIKLFQDGVEMARDDPQFNPPWYGTDLWTDYAIKFADEAIERKRPFFLYIAHVAPHFPCMAPEAVIKKYRGKYMKGWDVLREERYKRQVVLGFVDAEWKLTPRPPEIPAWDSLPEPDRKRYDDMMAIYAAMIEEIDRNVGNLVAALRSRKQLDNTLLLFLSDNGGSAEPSVAGKYEGERPGDPHSNVYIGKCWAHLNDTPFRKYKKYSHEGGIASPLIAHWPAGIKKGGEWAGTPAHLIDFMPTCVELAGADYPYEFKEQKILPVEGTSLVPLLTGSGNPPERALYWEHYGNGAIRVGDRKLVREGLKGSWELFDLKSDRTEQRDLAAENPGEVTRLRKRWEAWARRAMVVPRPVRRNR